MTTLLDSECGSASLADRALRPMPTPSTANRALLSQREPRLIPLPTLAGDIQISVIGPEPNWLYPALNAFSRLGQLELNWDSYGARRIHPQAIVGALQFLNLLFQADGPMPAVVPTSLGGVQLEWHQADFDIEVEVAPRGLTSALLTDRLAGTELELDQLTSAAVAQLRATLFR
jgi:hypothetical protein